MGRGIETGPVGPPVQAAAEAQTAPTVTGVALTSDPNDDDRTGDDATYAYYGSTLVQPDVVEVTVTFSAAVDITGTPQLELDFAGTAKAASCATGTNTTTMVCSYTVAENDSAPNGIAIAANKLTGGTIYATGSTTVNAVLTHSAVAIDSGHKVDGIRPTLVTTGNDAPQTSTDGTQVILTFSEDVGSFNLNNFSLIVDSKINQQQGATATFSGRTVTATLLPILTIQYGQTVELNLGQGAVTDAAGNISAPLTQDQAITNNVPQPPASIDTVAITSDPGTDKIYAPGDDIEVTATFDNAVNVSGTPRIEIRLVTDDYRWAEYSSGTGTTALVFSYTVETTDESSIDGITVGRTVLAADEVDLNVGTITTVTTGENASLNFAPLQADSGHLVNWARPTLSDAVTSKTDGTKVILTFSEDLDGETVGHSLFTVKVDGTAVTLSGMTATVSGNLVTLTLATALTSATQAVTVSYADPTSGDDSTGIEDLAGNDADSFTDQTVTNRFGLPEVSSVALTSVPGTDNTYAIGDAVEATVTFDASVDISGTPELELDFAGTAKAAACATGTNTTTMVCEYEVAVNDSAPNGVAIAANKLTGGTIYATGSTAVSADLDHVAVAIAAGHKVDGIRPTLVTTAPDAPTTSTDGTKVILTFSEDISAADRTKITIQANSVTAATSAESVTGTKVEITLTTALTSTATNLTVALAADAVADAASNGILAVAATPVTYAVSTTACTSSSTAVSGFSGTLTDLVTDCNTLLELMDTLRGTASLNWSADLNIAQWDGITASGTPPRVRAINLSSRDLSGSIPAQFEQLTGLTQLYLHFNELSGQIPVQLGQLTELGQLYLHINELSGQIPAQLGQLTELVHLSLDDNNLSGSIPAVLGDLTKLSTLHLDNNNLSGSIPTVLGGLTMLRALTLEDNNLSGQIPASLGQLTGLIQLYLHNNQLRGAIPTELWNLTNLTDLRLHNNQLVGEIPTQLGNLTNLNYLYLHGNLDAQYDNAVLSGPLPASFSSTGIRELHAQNTRITVPSSLESWAAGRIVTTGTAASSGTIPLAAANTTPVGVWANTTTLYVSDPIAQKVFAYTLADGSYTTIPMDAANTGAQGLWSDGTTLWVADLFAHKLFAYTLPGGERDNTKDIALEATFPRDLWSDGTTVWVVDHFRNVYAYTLADGSRDTNKSFSSTLISANLVPRGVSSDGTTLWVADDEDARLYAYTLATGSHDTTNYRVLDPGNTAPRGVWADAEGSTWYVVDAEDPAVYVYGPNRTWASQNRGPEAAGTLPDLTLAVNEEWPVQLTPAFRDPDGDELAYSVTSSAETTVLAQEQGNAVRIVGEAAGMATVRVTATDAEGSQQSATQEFTVTVVDGPLANRAPLAVGALPALNLVLEGADYPVGVEEGFTDPDGDSLTYSAASAQPQVATVTLSDAEVTVTPVGTGTTTVTVTATDLGGSQQSATQCFTVTVHRVSSTSISPGPGDCGGGDGSTVPPAVGAPDVPTSLSATRGNGQVMLSWVQPSGGAEVTGYEYEQDGSGAWIPTGSTDTDYTVMGLTNGQSYTFRVRAVTSAGASAASAASASVIPATAPGAPANIGVTGGDQEVELSWTAPASNGGESITGYEYEQSGSGAWISTGSTATGYTVMGLTNGQPYRFKVRAVNSVGPGAASAASLNVTPATAPDAPTGLGATVSDQSVDLIWTAPASNGGAALTHYEYELDASGTWTSTGSTATSTTVMGLTNGQSYAFRVRAVNSAGASGASGSQSATPTTTVPDAPESLSFTPGDGQVTLRWSPPGNDGGDTITHYEYEVDGSGIWIDTGSTATSTTVTGLDNGQAYIFRVRAVNAQGNGDPVTFEATPSPSSGRDGSGGDGDDDPREAQPQAPTNLLVERGDGQVTLTWEAPEGDGGAAIIDYEYRINGQGDWISTGSTDTTHTVTGLDNGTEYTFEVRAVSRNRKGRASDRVEATPGMPAPLDFTHFANGAGIVSDLVFVNVSPRPIQPALYFYGPGGDPIDPASLIDVTADMEVAGDGSLIVLKAMEPLGELTIRTHGRGDLVSGSVKVVSEGPIGGVLRYSVPGAGMAGVGASPPAGDVLFPVRRQEGGITTAAALHNVGAEALGVSCHLMSGGVALEEAEIALEANGQTSWYIEEAFPATDTSDFSGSVRCAAAGSGRFTAIAAEMDAARHIFTTVPVVEVNRGRAGAATLDFAHFANGTWITDLVFVNRETRQSGPPLTPFHTAIPPTRPAIYFYDTAGNPIAPASVVDITVDLEVTEDGALSLRTEMEPLGVLTISTHGRGNLVSGSVKVVSEGPIGGTVRFDHPGLGVAGVAASSPVNDAIFPVRRQEGGITTGVALHNLESSPGLVRCELMREGVLLETASIHLDPNGQTSWFIDGAFPATDTSGFSGSVRCSSPGEGLFTVVALEMDPGSRIFTTLPVVAVLP